MNEYKFQKILDSSTRNCSETLNNFFFQISFECPSQLQPAKGRKESLGNRSYMDYNRKLYLNNGFLIRFPLSPSQLLISSYLLSVDCYLYKPLWTLFSCWQSIHEPMNTHAVDKMQLNIQGHTQEQQLMNISVLGLSSGTTE